MNEPSKGVLLVVDDEPLKRVTLQIELTEAGYTVLEAPDAIAALRQLQTRPVDVVVTDVRMPELDGMQFLERIKAQFPRTHVILITAFGSVDAAVKAIKQGAYDYVTKPFPTEVLLEKIDRLLAGHEVADASGQGQTETLGPLLGRSYPARRLFEQVRSIANGHQSVVVEGEAGTCRERVAEAIHQIGQRSAGPLVKMSCAGSAAEGIERALFGTAGRAGGPGQMGGLEQANGGILFIDHIDALPVETQNRLLSALDEGSFERSDGRGRVAINARVICGTEQDLRGRVAGGVFREDLYYRLNTVHLTIPPLRDRREDIPVLARHYLKQSAAATDGDNGPRQIHPRAMDALVSYHWPGNLRELKHVVERAMAFTDSEQIEARDILLPVSDGSGEQTADSAETATTDLTETIAGVERTLIDAALRRAAGNQAKAAQSLGIPRTTLRDKMAKYGMVGKPVKSGAED